mgnify:FL=1
MIQKLKKYKFHLLAFIIPIVVLEFIYIIRCQLRGSTFFISDSYGQYLPLFSYFKDVIDSKQSLMYSFSKGIGGSMFGTYAYYLASPLNFLIIFFSKSNLYIFFAFIIILKIGLSSLFMYIYVDKRKINQPLKLIVSICYALMAYNINYYFHVMWLDGIFLAPLLLLGIEKLIDQNKSLLYGIVLFLAILSNYYIGFMLCIFSCLYFSYYLFINYNKQGKKYIFDRIKKFIITSFLAGMATIILILPALLELLSISRSNIPMDNKFKILEFLSKGYIASNNYENILNNSYVNWYAGIIILLGSLLYIFNKKIPLKEKIASLIIILIFFLSFKIDFLNIMWHGFSVPNCFNYRYSFLFSLFLILLFIRNFEKYNEIKKENYLILLLIITIISLIVILQNYNWINYIFVWISVFLFIIYYLLLKQLYSSKNKKDIKIIELLLPLLVISELSFNIFLIYRDNDFSYINDYNEFLNRGNIAYNNKDDFYRMEYTMINTSNDSLGLNYRGITTFLSTFDTDVINFMINNGYSYKNNNITNNNNNTIIMDSLLGVKRIYTPKDYSTIYKKIDEYQCSTLNGIFYELGKTKCGIYDNKNALNFGYMINYDEKRYLKEINSNKTNVFENQNSLLNNMLNKDEKHFKSYKIKPIKIDKYKYKLNDENTIYLYMYVYSEEKDFNINVYINDKKVTDLTYNDLGIQKIKNEWKNQEITLTFDVKGDAQIFTAPLLYYLDQENLENNLTTLKENEFKLKKVSNTYINGTIDVKDDNKVLFTSIPYDKGWAVKVDGKKVKVQKLYNTFLGVKLKEGKHKVEFEYSTPGLKLGTSISIISIVLMILYLKHEKEF